MIIVTVSIKISKTSVLSEFVFTLALLSNKIIVFNFSVQPLQPIMTTQDDQTRIITSTSQQVRYQHDEEDQDETDLNQ